MVEVKGAHDTATSIGNTLRFIHSFLWFSQSHPHTHARAHAYTHRHIDTHTHTDRHGHTNAHTHQAVLD